MKPHVRWRSLSNRTVVWLWVLLVGGSVIASVMAVGIARAAPWIGARTGASTRR